ncbi:transcriptional repressor [Bacteroidia bacterium]|nr:transcriptional repressor [Bacteroidia bacterium]
MMKASADTSVDTSTTKTAREASADISVDTSTTKTARELFTDYMVAHKCRKTPERYAILEEIYAEQKHLTVKTIHDNLREKKYRVSVAALYNTMQLLMDAGLVLKHNFNGEEAQYERVYGYELHEHLICRQCGKVEELVEPKISKVVKNACRVKGFREESRLFYVYGMCARCQKKKNRINILKQIKKIKTHGKS